MEFSGNVDNGTRNRLLDFSGDLDHCKNLEILKDFFPHPLSAVWVLFSPMVSEWVGGRSGWLAGGHKSLSMLYLRNREP